MARPPSMSCLVRTSMTPWRLGAACLVVLCLLTGRPAAQGRPIRLVGGSNYPPLSYLDNGEPRGYDVDVARALGRVLGRTVSVELMDWQTAQEQVLRGAADGLTNLAISNERRDQFEFAESTITQNFGLFARVGETSIGRVDQLDGKRVGVTEWGFPRQYLTAQRGVELVVIEDLHDGFARLTGGTLDAVAADVWVAAHIIEQERITGIALVGAPFASVPAAIAIRQGNHELVLAINDAIRRLEADGTLTDIQERWRPREMVFVSRERFQNLIAYGVAALLFVLLLATGIWALTLGRQIRRRRLSEDALRESSERLGVALLAADMGTWRWSALTNRDTRDATLNRILGLEAVETVNELDDFFKRVHPDDRAATRDAFDTAIRERGVYSVEYRIVHPDGAIRWLRARGRGYFDESGTLQFFTGTVLDITERREVEARVELLAHAFRSASDSMIITDPSERILSVNAAFVRLYEYSEAEAVGQPIQVIRSSEIPPAWMSMGEDTWRGEIWNRSKSGREFRVDVALSALRDAKGELIATVGVARDITHETLAAEALRASEEKFFKVFQASPDSIIITDRESAAVIDVNDSFERTTGYTRAEILGRTLHDVGLYVDPEWRARTMARAGDERSVRDIEFQIRCKSGEVATLLLAGEVIELGGRSCFLAIARDISDRKRFEIHLRQAVEVNKLLLAELDPEELDVAIIEAANQILALDYASLVLHDAENGTLRLQSQRGIRGSERASGAAAAISQEAFERTKIRVFDQDALLRLGSQVTGLVEAGLLTVCSLPLATSRGTLGCLNVGSRREHAFSDDDLTLLQQLSTHVAIAIQNARAFEQITLLKDHISQEKLYLEEEIRVSHNFADIVGESPAIHRVLQQIETVAPTDASVLLLGETGTGKELLARALHELSPRKDRTFVKVNAAALPATLLESELFGYERGAFTGAMQGKVGRMELAHRGTLFLDEIGDIPLEVQPKLLRALQEREFERLGSTRSQRVDVRFIAATNRDLKKMVEEGTFRSDLYYRLNVFPLRVPPLRERREDIPLLVRYFVQKFAVRLKRPITSIPAGTMAALQDWDWPGNIRELENVIERAVIVTTGDSLQVPALPTRPAPPPMPVPEPAGTIVMPSSALSTFEEGERNIILRALRDANGVIAGPEGAAARLGVKRTTLQSKMRKLGIRRPAF